MIYIPIIYLEITPILSVKNLPTVQIAVQRRARIQKTIIINLTLHNLTLPIR